MLSFSRSVRRRLRVKRCAKVLALIAFALLPAGADAAIITYTSSAAFFAAAGGGVATETYESLVLNSLISDGSTVNGVTYGFLAGRSGRVDNLYQRIGNQSLAAAPPADGFFSPGESITVTFTSAVNAVGIFVNINPSPPSSLQVQTAAGAAGNGAVYDVLSLYFVGLISDVAFNSATIAGLGNAGSGFNLDNLSYRPAAAAIPEPVSMALLGLGLVLAGLRARR